MTATPAWRMVAGLALAAASTAALPYVHCDSPEKSREVWRAFEPQRKALADKDIGALEKAFSGILARYAQGQLTDSEVSWAFRTFRTESAEAEPLHARWVKAHPKSEAAHLAQAHYYISRAWAGRGNAFADKTAPTQFAAMEQALERAWRSLDAAEPLSRRPAIEWGQRIEILGTMGSQAQEEATRLYRKALREDPKAVALRVNYLGASTPRWGGSLRQMRQIGEDAATLDAADRRYVEYLLNYHTGADYDLRKDEARAIEYYERAMPLCPGFNDASGPAMKLHRRANNWPAVAAAATRYLAAKPDDGWALSMRAYAALQANNLDDSFKDYQRATQLGYPQAFEALAWYYEAGRGGASRDFQKAIDLYMIAYEKGITGAKEKAEKVRAGAEKAEKVRAAAGLK